MSDASLRIDLSSVRPINATLKAVPISEAPEDLFQQIMTAKKEMLELDYSRHPDTSRNPTYAKYATVVANGKVVATIDNHGFVETSNAMGDVCADAIENADASAGVTSGPLLAQARAEKIAAAVHGSIVRAPTAMSQSAFNAVPQPKVTVDDAAMRRDPRYAELEQLNQARAVFLAQQMAQGGGNA
ncbi:hypothetical protein [Solidesulfovibrio sp.]|jgi:hypothetical protein|uniref:hypothetical protein n=1 Tax=Solidesulfovibrio sp. TaxID=2910990 RepID=UPI000EC25479|nr:hypothetical protein [Solidesulfovibrio sp.]MEA5087469.1 hypothetical protein [Solidesulfovibrio sp.]HCR13629.1 hypothetical protein [Desulfovibrio sp.]HML61000.1 hypothetical protein [Solidesulfovibrio sp.]